MSNDYYTITEADVGQFAITCFGKSWTVEDFLGRVLNQDVGKRVYQRGDILQVENYLQLEARERGETQPITSPYLQDMLDASALRLEGAERYCHGKAALVNVLDHVRMALRQVHATQAMMQHKQSEPSCECADRSCPQATVADGHLLLENCGQPAVQHFFRVDMEDGPIDFCVPCGDDAMKSGLFVTGEDRAADLVEAERRP